MPGLLPVPFDVKVIAFLPHMHLRGKAFRYEVTPKGGRKRYCSTSRGTTSTGNCGTSWPSPRRSRRGASCGATGWYDNSAKNPANPDPTATVRWGKQTFEEMMLGYVEYYIP